MATAERVSTSGRLVGYPSAETRTPEIPAGRYRRTVYVIANVCPRHREVAESLAREVFLRAF